MNDQNALRDIFKQLSNTKTSEREILNKLTPLKPPNPELISFELFSELMAFEFDEKKEGQLSEWGTHFAPMIVINYSNGSRFESPSITKISQEIIRYWQKRSEEESHPVVVTRYLGLVYDFTEKFDYAKPSIDLVLKYIDNLILIIEKKCHSEPYQAFERIRFAMYLTVLYNQPQFISRIKKAIIDYEKDQPDDSPGYWGHSFEALIDNKKVALSIEEEELIITELENRLRRITEQSAQEIKPWIAEEAAKYLAAYYLKRKRVDDVRRVLQKVETAYDLLIDKSPAMQSSGWLEGLHNLYLQFGQKDLSDRILVRLRAIGPKVADSLGTVEFETSFKKEKLDNYLAAIFTGSFEEILIRITNSNLPRKDIAKEQLLKVSKENHFRFLVRTAIQDQKGRIVASIGPISHDMEGQLIRHISDSISFGAPLLNLCFKELSSRFTVTPEILFEFINRGKMIEESHYRIVLRGLESYLNKQYLESIHILIPQVEDALRNMYESLGGAVLKGKEGKFELKLLDEILREPLMIETLTEDISTYFKILLTDPRGWNMRNNVCHGFYPIGAFNSQSADRLIHALLCLGLFQKVENYNNGMVR